MSLRESALFVFAPSAYAKTPLQGRWVFTHGTLQQSTTQGNEHRVWVEDAKGQWEGYLYALPQEINNGTSVRGYGQLKVQPDGSCKIALHWLKPIHEDEKQYIEKQTHTHWQKLVQEFPQLPMLQPFTSKPIIVQEKPIAKPAPQQEEFVPASELHVEQDYV
ncbi:MAG: hypothetical protein IPJ89_05395 [Candidatus Iainarchaeum archaeon]|uniref:Uncharacterized protein n=1 Tax=Candidatus Iainarchaeum sp. TaxID=3101447 RepID=A0A7T9DJL6_9ARCH|nr:MAG: hypothetical protein IPJ89_05395 [Candidatus Diapherotrites archaeon]